MKFLLTILAFLAIVMHTKSQETFPDNGPRNTVHNYHVFIHATIITSPGSILEDATLIIRDEKISAIGTNLEIPSNSVVHDLKGKWIYPSFIELDSDYGLKMDKKSAFQVSRSRTPQYDSKKKGAYSWNEAIHPETSAAEEFQVNEESAKRLRNMGFATVLTHAHDGIMRGSSVLVYTGSQKENLSILKLKAANHYSFRKGTSRQSYPSSMMGSIALLRQTFYDSDWYAGDEGKEEINYSYEAIKENHELPNIFEVNDCLSALRADKISDEFDLNMIIRGSGDEYKRLEEIKETQTSFIIPMKLPKPYDVSNAYDAIDLSLKRMKEWEMAPFNARILSEAGVSIALSSKDLKNEEFWKNLRALRTNGMIEQKILEALTTAPANMIGMEDELGKIESHYVANFFISDGNIFDQNSTVYEHWINGKRYNVNLEKIEIRGTYNLNMNGGKKLFIEGSRNKPNARIESGSEKTPVDISISGHEVQMRYKVVDSDDQYVLLSGQVNDDESRIWVGKAQLSDGKWVDWAAVKQSDYTPSDTLKKQNDSIEIPKITYPLGAYGFDTMPEFKTVIFKHATLWTNEDTGIVENVDICIHEGKILAIGNSLSRVSLFGTTDVDVEVVEAKGKHITSGIIDEHSHIAISKGVNESGQAVSAEVSIGDVVNSDDINIYRQLSGGVTSSQLLHGSANPIGGQSALIKMRWGRNPEQMKIENADGFIKFALGENVKQSNWGTDHRIRYPQTRMGVEQVFYDGFIRAKEYGEIWKIYTSGLKNKRQKKNTSIQPRRDLELEVLAQILDTQRFVTCHSYVQSEINMLMHVADSMGFRVNTFTHILEGYKVAERMKKHGAGGSSFSDWWAYKYEVNDAIPYNAALLNEFGIVTAINSDDAEMGRRLNQEAAKAVKYGAVSEEDAWKMVTLNPAKLLHLDDRMGSLKLGNDADIVLWSDNPLSVNAKAERTYVDGICYFDVERDLLMRKDISAERSRLIQKMIAEKKKGRKTQNVNKKEKKQYHCDTIEDEMLEDI